MRIEVVAKKFHFVDGNNDGEELTFSGVDWMVECE